MAGDAAPSPVAWSLRPETRGGTGWGCPPRAGLDSPYAQLAVWLPRVTSSSFSQSPSQSGRRGLWPVKSCPVSARQSASVLVEPLLPSPYKLPGVARPAESAREAHSQS